ncbi:prolipoprotein diacylglyceryl transferase [Porphyromonas crevioricanis]|uniref:Phosphatidylglycerol--prolipoprotein diacylglyceryl transferase n=2 Tax=Porphyromonas crevioricanis TaxID=393921 RepID=A0A0A2FYP3_9PORP|nr:prolipoprotein diacylglyceryl transferase [Porphyromonas crevioricanis]KGN90216.1 prolipoprotein diacylglyceryl transferase [Porphyromonas crevioricanis]KGN96136.1 prolipoprotein diacylglyceryl transferase [Porphyromonas crevioricanis]SKA02903.1 Prolipoprotein diacylglyceryl transferase [Porphyromonas crevioricanis]SQH72619.1 Prolipoprotein diacylglyceryl transferase [Porphyromonas crevioricanis]GAD05886.1 prolipoprotein diacylglyceryl transferase [Porphyromonas crevioricanis JCM 15906]
MINWTVSPEIFTLFDHEIRWYGLLFGVGLIVFGPMIMSVIWKREQLKEDWMRKMGIYVFIGTIVGARLGHVLFYDLGYYLSNPIKILAIHEGGLASHGGTIGVLVGMWLYGKYVTGKGFLWGLDRLAVPVGLVAAMIRLGNLMNSEIFGRATSLPWGFRFLRSHDYWSEVVGSPDYSSVWDQIPPEMVQNLPAVHPTQIYEAICYLIVFGICLWLYFCYNATRKYNGLIVGVFLIGIFGSRFFIEMLKLVQEPWELQLIDSIGMNMGQLLSIPFLALGIYWVVRAIGQSRKHQTVSIDQQ